MRPTCPHNYRFKWDYADDYHWVVIWYCPFCGCDNNRIVTEFDDEEFFEAVESIPLRACMACGRSIDAGGFDCSCEEDENEDGQFGLGGDWWKSPEA